MENKLSIKKLKISYSTIFLLIMSVFFITKMFRAFSSSTAQGGVWVFIQSFIVVFGAILMVKRYRQTLKNGALISLLIYTVISMLNSLFTLNFTINNLYSYAMIPYAVCVLALFVFDGENREIEDNLILTVTYYVISAIFLYSMLRPGNYSTAIGAVSDSYYVIGLLPIMLVFNKKQPLIPIFVAGLVIMVSGKRAGMIACALMVIAYYILEALRTKRHKDFAISFFSLLIIVIVVIVAFNFINQNFNSRLLTRLLRLQQDGGSGRSNKWVYLLDEFNNSSVFKMVFGHGDTAAKQLTGHAHNDFIELLYNYGIFSVLSYISFYIYLITQFIKMLKSKYEYAAQFLMAIICSFCMAFFSYYVIDATYITSGMICIGYLFSDYKKKERIKFLEQTED